MYNACILFLMAFCFSYLRAGITVEEQFDYTRTLREIQRKEAGGRVAFWIELSDSSIWKWETNTCCEQLIRKWEQGDEIWLRNSDSNSFLLYNRSSPRFSPPVTLVTQAQSHILTLDELSLDGKYLVLSDGSKWTLLFDFQASFTHDWQIGDFIFPTKCATKDYELINIDIPYSPRQANHRHVNAHLQSAPLLQFRSSKVGEVVEER